MKFLVFLIVTIATFALTSGKAVHEFPRAVQTQTANFNENYKATWAVDDFSKTLTVSLEVKTNGWVGFGISDSGTMENADLIIAGELNNGTKYFTVRICLNFLFYVPTYRI